MNSLLLIAQREYYSRIKKKSFILLTILIPFLLAGLIFLPFLLSQIKDFEPKHIVVIDQTGLYAPHFQSSNTYFFDIATKKQKEVKSEIGKGIFGVLKITGDLNKNAKAVTFLSEKQVPMDLLVYINQTLNEKTKEDRLSEYTQQISLDEEIVQSIQNILESSNKISVTTIRLEQDGTEKESSVEMASALGFALIMFMYMFIMTYGAMVMQGVVEEKTNRIVEVIVASVRPFNLMMGKIIGIALVGFTQLFIWLLMGAILLGAGTSLTAQSVVDENTFTYLELLSQIDWLYLLGFFLLFFIGGYLIYASIFAMFASAVDNSQDTQQFVMPITIIFVFALYAGMYSVNNPDGPLAFWCSVIPLTSPIVMMVRIPSGAPLWEILLSLCILYFSVFFMIKLAAKIYRVGILMYGKKPSLKELYKWMKYKY